MTVTETDVPAEAASDAPALVPPTPTTGVVGVIGSGDHKIIGRLWVVTSLVYLLIAGLAGGLAGIEKIDTADIDIVDVDVFGQIFSLHAIGGTFLFLIPMLIGLATVVVPLQVGSSTIAFPVAAAAAYWSYLVAGLVTLVAFVVDGGPFGADPDAVNLFLVAVGAVLVALVLASVCIATTVIALRTPDMGLHRGTPLFAWSNLVAAVLFVLTLPILVGLVLLVYIDHRYGQTFLGGSGGVLNRVAWAWGQPSVYVFAIPALGIVGDVVPVAAQTRITLHKVAMGCIAAFGVFAFGAWAMPGFSASDLAGDLAYYDEIPFYAFSALAALPVLLLFGLLADTLRRGGVRLISPLLWSIGGMLLLLGATIIGILVSIEPFDLLGTTAHAAHTHAVVGATLLALFGGLAYWSPKLFGRSVSEAASNALAVGGLLGVALLALPDLITGFLGQFARLGGTADNVDATEALNVVSLAGGALLILVALGFVGLLLSTAAASGTAPAADDPWDGHTLEWATSSPPAGNFTDLPAISSEAPLYDARHGQGGETEEDAG